MDEGVLAQWLVADGAQVEAGAPIYSLETEKASQDIEAPCPGKLKIIGEAGETYPVGELIGQIE